ncbi:MAG TPA: hypothetical protein VNN80_11160 [Polyangiaceae bacterium]|nr:hypothetical protein [Polyangiaceae bacterium]
MLGATACDTRIPSAHRARRSHGSSSEVALDYNAGIVGLSAFGVLQQRLAAPIQ